MQKTDRVIIMVPPFSQVVVTFYSSLGELLSSKVLSNTSPSLVSMYALNEIESELFEIELKPLLLH
ncbi:hypothetical protein FHY71_07870 [Bacillus tropicus]|uniref:Uncharacterized protein n=1 Tax=Bacillus tropicus TaxID=2026188 RepID=A0A5C5A9X7_9BACI|nr:hypothetical protein [Bacillus tropicus]TNP16398.1 hypothetical protein FHY71_07870 [Bacillus tropicus]